MQVLYRAFVVRAPVSHSAARYEPSVLEKFRLHRKSRSERYDERKREEKKKKKKT